MPDPTVRFDAAINPYGCSPAVVQAITRAAAARDYRHYGDPHATALRERLAAQLGVRPTEVAVYNGSGEAYVWQCVDRLMARRGTFLAPHPSYERFVDVARRTAAHVHAVDLVLDGWRLDVAAFVERARETRANLAMISSPNNPTGNRLLDAASVCAIADALPECTLVVDEAYAEYAGVTFAALAVERRNLIVLKTFSKAYGLAGLRIGYLVGHAEVVARALAYQIPWSVDTLALVAAEAAVADQPYVTRIVAQINADVRALGDALGALDGFTVHPTDANFVWVDVADAAREPVRAALDAAGLAVRRRADMPRHLRITSMLPEHNLVLLRVLGDAVARV